MKNLKFHHYVCDSFYNYMNVAVFKDLSDPDQTLRILIAVKNGDGFCRRTITADKYSALLSEWTEDGRLFDNDVRILFSALEWMDPYDPFRESAKHRVK